MTEFEKYATLGQRIPTTTLERYASYINPSIIEERRMNIASMDVFSRLMMDRIIFLGVPIDDDVANIIQAKLYSWHQLTRRLIYQCISTLLAERECRTGNIRTAYPIGRNGRTFAYQKNENTSILHNMVSSIY